MLNTLYCIANKQTKTRKSFKIKEKKKNQEGIPKSLQTKKSYSI